MDGFRYDYEFCDWSDDAGTAEELIAAGRRHLTAEHADELATAFADTFGGEACRNGCGYVFPASVEDGVGHECPRCGHDHLPVFLKRYLYWRIERA